MEFAGYSYLSYGRGETGYGFATLVTPDKVSLLTYNVNPLVDGQVIWSKSRKVKPESEVIVK